MITKFSLEVDKHQVQYALNKVCGFPPALENIFRYIADDDCPHCENYVTNNSDEIVLTFIKDSQYPERIKMRCRCCNCGEELITGFLSINYISLDTFIEEACTSYSESEEFTKFLRTPLTSNPAPTQQVNQVLNNNNNNEKGGNNMFSNLLKGFAFGSLSNSNDFRISHLGVAVKNSNGVFVAYDKSKKEIVDVDFLDLNMNDLLYQMPVVLNQVEEGNIILHNGKAVVVEGKEGKDLKVIDVVNGERKTIMPTKSAFGFDFFTKIQPLLDFSSMMNADSENPIASLLPLMLLSDKGNGSSMDKMLPLMLLSGGNSSEMFSNPMMMMLLMGDNKSGNSDMMSTMLMMSMFSGDNNPFNFGAKKKEVVAEVAEDRE